MGASESGREWRSLNTAMKEIDRLREALQDIANMDGYGGEVGICNYGCHAPTIARRALLRKQRCR